MGLEAAGPEQHGIGAEGGADARVGGQAVGCRLLSQYRLNKAPVQTQTPNRSVLSGLLRQYRKPTPLCR